MPIPGIPDNQLEHLHWNYSNGRGAVGLRHLPSGITVSRECLPDTSVWQVMQELEAELKEALQRAGCDL